jgi:hypothetical protein
LKTQFLTLIKDNPLFSKILESKWFDSPAITTHRYKFLAVNHLSETIHSYKAFLVEKEKREQSRPNSGNTLWIEKIRQMITKESGVSDDEIIE